MKRLEVKRHEFLCIAELFRLSEGIEAFSVLYPRASFQFTKKYLSYACLVF